ncbi:MAG: methylmalonyl-CoA mutase [Deltaproteobacteria bacterium]|nr:methylmalonyl-CoA mutase [Deltaproteobacteria bacterium]
MSANSKEEAKNQAAQDQKSQKGEKGLRTLSGYPVPKFYTAEDLKAFDIEAELGHPGDYPFTRGITEDMYREKFWVMSQYAGFGTARESNERFKYLIAKGGSGVGIALDLPTQLGMDSDHPQAQGEVGRTGVAIDSLRDIEIMLEGIPLEKVGIIRTTANAIGPIACAWLVALGEKRGCPPTTFSVRLQNDVLKEFVARGTHIFPPAPSVKLCIDALEYCARHVPNWLPLTACGSHMRQAGGKVKHELGFAIANAIAYADEAIRRGLKIEDFAPTLTFHFLIHKDFFEEIAKYRAARRVWAKLVKTRYGSDDAESQKMHISAYTAGVTLTAQQPLNNVSRVTLQALAAVLGGVQYLATSSYDEALSLPSEEAVTIALRTQQIIAHESGVASVADPLGGSYFLEHLTDAIEKDVWAVLEEVEKKGGAVEAISQGFYQKELMESAWEQQRAIDRGEEIVVGVNQYETGEEIEMPSFRVNPAVEKEQLENLARLKQERDSQAVQRGLEAVRVAGKKNENLVPSLVEAVKAYATIGEICDVLREVYGEYKEPLSFLR